MHVWMLTEDNAFQSGVFLEAYSFDIGEILVNWGSMNRGQESLCY